MLGYYLQKRDGLYLIFTPEGNMIRTHGCFARAIKEKNHLNKEYYNER